MTSTTGGSPMQDKNISLSKVIAVIDGVSKSNDDITKYGDGFESATVMIRNGVNAIQPTPAPPMQDKKKFILGFNSPDDDFLTEYPDKKTASYESEEWCEVEATSLEEAKDLYEETYAKLGTVTPPMQESKHTEGKVYADGLAVVAEKGIQFELCVFTTDEDVPKKEAYANAERMAECWNTHDQLIAENERLRAVNEGLLKVLKEVVAWFPTPDERTKNIMNNLCKMI